MSPSEARAAAGGQARFSFAIIERPAIAYSVESAISSWCRLFLPAGEFGRGELVVDVPGDAGPGRYALRLVAIASGQEIAAANVMLRIAGERAGGEPCLRLLPRPKFDLQPDGTVVVSLQVVNCGNVDATLVVRARHEDGWSFSVDEPELVIGVQEGPVTVEVTLRPPSGHRVDHGDDITVEVNVGTGWQPVRGRVRRRLWPWAAAAAAALVVAAGVAAAVLASQDESNDSVTTDETPQETTEETTDETTDESEPQPEPVQIALFSVDNVDDPCTVTIEWDATGDSNGWLELHRDGELRETLPVGADSRTENTSSGPYTRVYELKAFDAEGNQTDHAISDLNGDCPVE